MSGARPGARRQQDHNNAQRNGVLERLTSARPGVDKVYVVHGGREVRIHVQEGRISDERAVQMSTEIAKEISDKLVFPGQIKVTVIREVRATSVAS
jgi:ribonuclease Y